MNKIIKRCMFVGGCLATMLPAVFMSNSSIAASFAVSPMYEKIALVPGQVYHGSLTVTNPAENSNDFSYEVNVLPFMMNDNYDVILAEKENYSMIVDWVSLEKESGTISPNDSDVINYTISVPEDAPAGGQYVAITVASAKGDPIAENVNIQQVMQIAYMVYANVAGNTVHDTIISDMNLPSFLLDGDITGSATITNNGNTHLDAYYKLQVFPIFSSEEIYTNEESPEGNIIMPETSRSTVVSWPETAMVGIFRVLFTVECDGQVGTIEKIVIVCPAWLLFIIIFVIFALIFYFVAKVKARKKAAKKAEKFA